jgi:coatomer subunit beta'
VNLKASESLADPAEYDELFPDLDLGIKAEKYMSAARRVLPLASSYPTIKPSIFRSIIAG